MLRQDKLAAMKVERANEQLGPSAFTAIHVRYSVVDLLGLAS